MKSEKVLGVLLLGGVVVYFINKMRGGLPLYTLWRRPTVEERLKIFKDLPPFSPETTRMFEEMRIVEEQFRAGSITGPQYNELIEKLHQKYGPIR